MRLLLSALIGFSAHLCIDSDLLFAQSGDPSKAVQIVDAQGRSRSFVELAPDGKATITALVQQPGAEKGSRGTSVSLVRIVPGKGEELVDTVTTIDSGEATFFNVLPGTYRMRVDCDQFLVDNVALKKIEQDDEQDAQQAGGQLEETSEFVNISDARGATRAVSEVKPGELVDAQVKIKSENGDQVDGQRVSLVELRDNVEADVFAGAILDEDGKAQFPQLAAGNYRLRVDCEYNLSSYKLSASKLLSALCPIAGVIP